MIVTDKYMSKVEELTGMKKDELERIIGQLWDKGYDYVTPMLIASRVPVDIAFGTLKCHCYCDKPRYEQSYLRVKWDDREIYVQMYRRSMRVIRRTPFYYNIRVLKEQCGDKFVYKRVNKPTYKYLLGEL